jgi:hypothetical protein
MRRRKGRLGGAEGFRIATREQHARTLGEKGLRDAAADAATRASDEYVPSVESKLHPITPTGQHLQGDYRRRKGA